MVSIRTEEVNIFSSNSPLATGQARISMSESQPFCLLYLRESGMKCWDLGKAEGQHQFSSVDVWATVLMSPIKPWTDIRSGKGTEGA